MKQDASNGNDGGTFKTIHCDDVWIEEPGDTTVRPIPAHRLARAQAEWAKILKYGDKDLLPKPSPEKEQPDQGNSQ